MRNLWKYTLLLWGICLVGCDKNTTDLEQDVAALKDRVTALENKTKLFNENIKAIEKLQKGVTIADVAYDTEKGEYKLTLSDGEVLHLVERIEQLELGIQIGISEQGNWQVSYDGGESFKELLTAGEVISAVGTDGQTPLFRVDGGDFWEVSYDSGASYVKVFNEEGNPVKAVSGDENDFFEAIIQKEDTLHLVLKDGTALEVPIIPNFYCYFDKLIEGVQRFEAGELKEFLVHLKGETNYLVTAPQGWKAWLERDNTRENVVTCKVVAPNAQTRASADSGSDIAILATAKGFAQIAKIEVELDRETPVEPELDGNLLAPFTTSTPIELLLNTDPHKTSRANDQFWFMRVNVNEEVLVENNGTITFELAKIADKDVPVARFDCLIANSFFKLALGHYNPSANCSIHKHYKLSFMLKGKGGTKFLATIRNGDNSGSFGVYNKDGVPDSSLQSFTISDADDGVWHRVSAIFDFSKKTEKVASVKENNPLLNSVIEDGKAIDIRLYPQAKNTTFWVSNVKLEEYLLQ